MLFRGNEILTTFFSCYVPLGLPYMLMKAKQMLNHVTLTSCARIAFFVLVSLLLIQFIISE